MLKDPVLKSNLEKLSKGMYLLPAFNPEFYFKDRPSFEQNYPRFENEELSSYGVCDYPKQLLEKFGEELRNPDREFSLFFTRIDKEDEPSDGGWRWHKWGEYIGDKEPCCEYLYDEGDDIEEVYCFHIIELTNPNNKESK